MCKSKANCKYGAFVLVGGTDMDAEIAASPMLTPYIMVIEGATQQYFVVAEKQIVAEVNKFDVAITALFACSVLHV